VSGCLRSLAVEAGGKAFSPPAVRPSPPSATFTPQQVVASAIVDKYIGESARVIREMFGYARDHQPCVIFMDEIDAIGGRRFSEGTSADREIQRTLMELLSQMDGFDVVGKVGRWLCWAGVGRWGGGLGLGRSLLQATQHKCIRAASSESHTGLIHPHHATPHQPHTTRSR